MALIDAVAQDTGEIVAVGPRGLDLPGRVSRVGLELPDDLSFDDWSSLGSTLKSVEGSIMWWIGDWMRYGERKWGEKYKEAIEVTDYAYGTLRIAKHVAEQYPDLLSRNNNLGFHHHRIAASLPDDQRREVLRDAEANGWSVRDVEAQVNRRKAAAAILASDPGDGTCTIADLFRAAHLGKKFGTIYADPPWQYDNQGTRAATGNHYGGMTVDELCAMPIAMLASDAAHLHLWTTNAFLFECPRIFKAWGFEFRSTFVWVKPQIGIGNYWRNSHEFLLTAVRGDAKRFNDHNLRSWIECERGKHSSKPEHVREFIQKASPGPYLELFARHPADGWAAWGNQIPQSIFAAGVKEVA